uniref:Wilms tumor protein homolog n=1 Tax=Hucho hucho TaxID=62062 RepID=A0A4W5JWI1_9TELE
MFCNKGFSSSQKVEIHQRVHTGVKPYSCTQCHMRFTQAGDLKRHQRVHTGVKPFSCTQCHMSFAQAGNLKRHQMVHTGEILQPPPVLREVLPQDTPAEKPSTDENHVRLVETHHWWENLHIFLKICRQLNGYLAIESNHSTQ